jgi:hypothetical protein
VGFGPAFFIVCRAWCTLFHHPEDDCGREACGPVLLVLNGVFVFCTDLVRVLSSRMVGVIVAHVLVKSSVLQSQAPFHFEVRGLSIGILSKTFAVSRGLNMNRQLFRSVAVSIVWLLALRTAIAAADCRETIPEVFPKNRSFSSLYISRFDRPF